MAGNFTEHETDKPHRDRRRPRRYQRSSRRILIPQSTSENGTDDGGSDNTDNSYHVYTTTGHIQEQRQENYENGTSNSEISSSVPNGNADTVFTSDANSNSGREVENYQNGHRTNELWRNSRDDSVFEEPVLRAKSARDLVRSQERLVDMLHNMKMDISRMDREASRIKEDVVRSKQIFDITIKKKEPHHLQMDRHGFNMMFSMPRVSYPVMQPQSSDGRPRSMRYLAQLSTYCTGSDSDTSSRRSSVTSAYAVACNLRAKHRRSIRESLAENGMPGGVGRLNVGRPTDEYSGTESDIDSTTYTSQNSSRDYDDQTVSVSDSDYTYEGGGSSTESADMQERYRASAGNANRRSSYFYTVRMATPPQSQADEIDL